ncbi:MAG: hypothetical protein ACFCGT_20045 [Sandaracinaceae bacterium]
MGAARRHVAKLRLAPIVVLLGCALSVDEVPEDQLELRSRLEAMGVMLDDRRARLATTEVARFVRSVGAYDEVGLQDPLLDRLIVRRGNPSFRYGSRPIVLYDRRAMVFWTDESGFAEEPGTVFQSMASHMFYFAHELGHLLHPTIEGELQAHFAALHEDSAPGVYTGVGGQAAGDFITSYAAETLEEDFAETFSFLTYARADWLYRRELQRACLARPRLAEKLLVIASAIAVPSWEPQGEGLLPVVLAQEAPLDPHGRVFEPRWLPVERDASGWVTSIHVPAGFAPGEPAVKISCDLVLRACWVEEGSPPPLPTGVANAAPLSHR